MRAAGRRFARDSTSPGGDGPSLAVVRARAAARRGMGRSRAADARLRPRHHRPRPPVRAARRDRPAPVPRRRDRPARPRTLRPRAAVDDRAAPRRPARDGARGRAALGRAQLRRAARARARGAPPRPHRPRRAARPGDLGAAAARARARRGRLPRPLVRLGRRGGRRRLADGTVFGAPRELLEEDFEAHLAARRGRPAAAPLRPQRGRRRLLRDEPDAAAGALRSRCSSRAARGDVCPPVLVEAYRETAGDLLEWSSCPAATSSCGTRSRRPPTRSRASSPPLEDPRAERARDELDARASPSRSPGRAPGSPRPPRASRAARTRPRPPSRGAPRGSSARRAPASRRPARAPGRRVEVEADVDEAAALEEGERVADRALDAAAVDLAHREDASRRARAGAPSPGSSERTPTIATRSTDGIGQPAPAKRSPARPARPRAASRGRCRSATTPGVEVAVRVDPEHAAGAAVRAIPPSVPIATEWSPPSTSGSRPSPEPARRGRRPACTRRGSPAGTAPARPRSAPTPGSRRHVAPVEARAAERLDAGVEPGVADRRRAHVDTATAGAEVEAGADHRDGLRLLLLTHRAKANLPRDGRPLRSRRPAAGADHGAPRGRRRRLPGLAPGADRRPARTAGRRRRHRRPRRDRARGALAPDACVLDLHMPLLDGVTTAARLRRDHRASA